MSHLTCTNCFERSPAEATRCKHCGRSFVPMPAGAADTKGRLSPIIGLLAVAALAVVVAWWWWPSVRAAPADAPADTAVAPAPPAPAPADTQPPPVAQRPAAPVDTVTETPRPAAPPPAESSPPAAEDSPEPRAPARAADPVGTDTAHQHYALDYANLRTEPSRSASVVRVLQPGELVMVDSLLDGWYRVVSGQQVVGYVDRQYVDTLPPSQP